MALGKMDDTDDVRTFLRSPTPLTTPHGQAINEIEIYLSYHPVTSAPVRGISPIRYHHRGSIRSLTRSGKDRPMNDCKE